MIERPILFSAPMVRAILDGRKSQTRRVVKPQPKNIGNGCWEYAEKVYTSDMEMGEHLFHDVYGSKGTPYGSVYADGDADRLWVRETFWTYPITNHLLRDGADTWPMIDGTPVAYNADGDQDVWRNLKWRKKPAIHMPRKLSRLTLEITDVRVERLQAISEEDAKAEGPSAGPDYCKPIVVGSPTVPEHIEYPGIDAREKFKRLWDTINGPGSWDANPWVWVVGFKQV